MEPIPILKFRRERKDVEVGIQNPLGARKVYRKSVENWFK